MILAAVGDSAYNLVLLLHVLTVMIALSPAFVQPLLRNRVRAAELGESQRLLVSMSAGLRRVYGPALIASGLLGFALAGLSDKVHSMREGWLIASAVIWVAMNGVLHALIIPALRSADDGSARASIERRVERGWALITVMAVAQLALMVIQPGG